jgi:hypothetical protein
MKSSCEADVLRLFTACILSHSLRIEEHLADKLFNSNEKRLVLVDLVFLNKLGGQIPRI